MEISIHSVFSVYAFYSLIFCLRRDCSVRHRGDDRIRQYDEVESLIFSHCLGHGMAPLTELYEGELIPSRAFAEGGIHEAIMAYEDVTFFEILAQEMALRDMDDPPITPENYDEVMERMGVYLMDFEQNGTDHISVELD